jgi:hypothetical protein
VSDASHLPGPPQDLRAFGLADAADMFALEPAVGWSSIAEPPEAAPSAVAPLEVRDVVLDPIFGKRRDALLRTVPVHRLAERAERSDVAFQAFDVRALALAAFDAVIARQGLSDQATPMQVAGLLSGIALVQDPTASLDTCEGVAELILDGLTNRRERERQFTFDAIVYASADRGEVIATSVPRAFWLLREQEDASSGQVHLHASSDAVIALVGGLDLPIEDEQAALEMILERQLSRGDLDSAYLAAEKTRRLSVGYIAKIDELLLETERYLPGTDWKVDAPRLIGAALQHLDECLAREGKLLEHVAAGREQQGTGAKAAHHARIFDRLTKLLGESRHLHTNLMRRLIGARARFLDAQDSQMFRPALTMVELHFGDDLLVPTLGLHTAGAADVTAQYLRGTLGPIAPVVLNWADFISALLHPAQVQTHPAELDEPEQEYRPDPPPLIDRGTLAEAHRVLALVSLPARLSRLIAACPEPAGPGAAPSDLIAAAALHGFDNAVRERHAEADDAANPSPHATGAVHLLEVLGPDAACYADGVQLNGPGWSGDDLIVCVDTDQLDAVRLGELPIPQPVPVPRRLSRGAT